MLSPVKVQMINPQVSNIFQEFYFIHNSRVTNTEEKAISPQRWTCATA